MSRTPAEIAASIAEHQTAIAALQAELAPLLNTGVQAEVAANVANDAPVVTTAAPSDPNAPSS